MTTFLITASCFAAACGSPGSKPAEPAAAAASGVSQVTGTVPKSAVVSLQPASGEAPMPDGPHVMDQYSKQFVPNVMYVRVGHPVEFRNSEDMPHNVTVHRRGTGAEIFNVSTEPQQKHVHTFDRVGPYDVTCDIHPGMQATLIAAGSPMATLADESGKFMLTDVRVGAYKLSVTFEGRTVEQAVEVSGPRTEVRLNP